MTNNNNGFGLIESDLASAFPVRCQGDVCSDSEKNLSADGSCYFTDTLTSKTYCQVCGNRLRYHRKKAAARGEDIPLNMSDVSSRFTFAKQKNKD